MKKINRNTSHGQQNDLVECACAANGEKQPECLSEGHCPKWEIVTVLPLAFKGGKMFLIKEKEEFGRKKPGFGKKKPGFGKKNSQSTTNTLNSDPTDAKKKNN